MSILQRYFFEVFFNEFDIIANTFFNSLNSSSKIFYFSKFFQVFPGFPKSFITLFFPVKLSRTLFKFYNLNRFFELKKQGFIKYFSVQCISNYFKIFTRKVFYARYLDNFVIGIIGNNKFAKYIKSNFISFLRSNFQSDVREMEIFQSKNFGLFFAGFNISVFEKKFSNKFSFFSIQIKQKYGARLLAKLNYFRKKLHSSTSTRLYSELFVCFQRILQKNSKKFLSPDLKFLWTYIFQLEAVRSFQYGKLLLNNDSFDLPGRSLLLKLKNSKVFSYDTYSFNLYISKQSFFLKEILKNSSIHINNSVFPFDIAVESLLKELFKKIQFYNEGLYFKEFMKKKIIGSSKNCYYYGLKFTKKDLFDLQRNFSVNDSGNLRQKFFICLNFPSSYLFNKFRSLGFVHLRKNRPIGNPFFFSLEDTEIIDQFGYIANILLNWFRCCDNFIKVKFFVEFLRRSCFLTLCRKHNKSKNWAYGIYTPNLLLSTSIFNKNSSFPSKVFVSCLKSKFLFKIQDLYFFDEDFILN